MYVYRRQRRSLVKAIQEKQRSELKRSDIQSYYCGRIIRFLLRCSQLQLQKIIGRGGAGEVYTALFRGTKVAAKRLDTSKASKDAMQEIYLESAIMCSLRHPNIVLFMGSCYGILSRNISPVI